jgi:hypothetical protein
MVLLKTILFGGPEATKLEQNPSKSILKMIVAFIYNSMAKMEQHSPPATRTAQIAKN